DLEQGKKTADIPLPEKQFGLAGQPTISPDQKLLAVPCHGGGKKLVFVWGLIEKKEAAQLPFGPPRRARRIFRPHGQRLAGGLEEGDIRIMDTLTGQETLALEGAHDTTSEELRWLPDGRHLISLGWDGNLKKWQLAPPATSALPYRCWDFAVSPDE